MISATNAHRPPDVCIVVWRIIKIYDPFQQQLPCVSTIRLKWRLLLFIGHYKITVTRGVRTTVWQRFLYQSKKNSKNLKNAWSYLRSCWPGWYSNGLVWDYTELFFENFENTVFRRLYVHSGAKVRFNTQSLSLVSFRNKKLWFWLIKKMLFSAKLYIKLTENNSFSRTWKKNHTPRCLILIVPFVEKVGFFR